MPAVPLAPPPSGLATDDSLPVTRVLPRRLVRISQYPAGEPHFDASGANRFDAPGCLAGTPEFGFDGRHTQTPIRTRRPCLHRFLLCHPTVVTGCIQELAGLRWICICHGISTPSAPSFCSTALLPRFTASHHRGCCRTPPVSPPPQPLLILSPLKGHDLGG